MSDSENLKLLAGKPFYIDNIEIKPLTLEQIANTGYEQYSLYLSNIVADPSDFSLHEDININEITTYDIILGNMYYGTDEYRELILNALKLFLQQKVRFAYCKGVFYIDDFKDNKIINKNTYEKLRAILKIQNCLNNKNKDEDFANERAKEIYKKMMKGQQSIGKTKTNVKFEDLISVLAANGNGLNILNVWCLTRYQFNDQFARMQMIEDYDINIRSLLAGVKSEDIKLKHYISPIDSD